MFSVLFQHTSSEIQQHKFYDNNGHDVYLEGIAILFVNSDVMISMLAMSALDCWFEPQSGEIQGL